MILNTRVDHRLLHGQVAFAWSNHLNVNCILIANDDVPKDELRKNTMRLARPQGVKLIMKPIDECIEAINTGLTDKYRMFVVVESVKDAHRLIKGTKGAIKELTLGGTKATSETINISKAVNLTEDEFSLLDELVDQHVDISIQMVPSDRKIDYTNVKRR